MTTEEIDKTVHEYIISHGAYPSPLHYKGFPKSICTSINNVVCHGTTQYNNVVSLFFFNIIFYHFSINIGIPDNRSLLDGDIINIDVTVSFKKEHNDLK